MRTSEKTREATSGFLFTAIFLNFTVNKIYLNNHVLLKTNLSNIVFYVFHTLQLHFPFLRVGVKSWVTYILNDV